jgi:uncharacterized protein (TIGR02145 family)
MKIINFTILLLTIFEPYGKTYQEKSSTKTKNEINIGNQIWMNSNLNVDHFRNGDIIPQAKNGDDWDKALYKQQPVWCYYRYNTQNGIRFGKIYNIYALEDNRGLAPKGWHIPSKSEWRELFFVQIFHPTYVESHSIPSEKFKSRTGWSSYSNCSRCDLIDGNGTNETGFNVLPGGCYNYYGFKISEGTGFWSVTAEPKSCGNEHLKPGHLRSKYVVLVTTINGGINESCGNINDGYYIRCIKD